MTSNPNGLTDAQIQARPEPYAGMYYWDFPLERWVLIRAVRDYNLYTDYGVFAVARIRLWGLLPGEPGCPPVPVELQRNWVEGDEAWLLCQHGSILYAECYCWIKVKAGTCPECYPEGTLTFHKDEPDNCFGGCENWDALYIPESEAA